MIRVVCIFASTAVLSLAIVPLPAIADSCDGSGDGVQDAFSLEVTCADPGGDSNSGGADAVDSGSSGEPAYLAFMWHTPCVRFSPNHTPTDSASCGIARACPDPVERSWQLWGQRADTRAWEYITIECFGRPPAAAQAPRPQVTAALVLNEIRRIGLPTLEAKTQPTDKTLVNFATIFYAEPQPFARTVRLLGQRVDIEANATEYTWHHGDGTTTTTGTPGAPYPSKEITHNYTDAHVTVSPSVDVKYSARFRVNGGAWQDIDETVTIAGPASDLRISEATAVLSGSYE